MNERELTVLEHMEELRKRLGTSAVFFVLSIVGGFFLAKPVVKYIQFTGKEYHVDLHAFSVTTPLMIYIQVTFIIAFVLTLPIILYQVWAFVSPGLSDTERRVTLSYIPYSVILFLMGIAFSYFILFPYMMKFMMALSDELAITQVIGIQEFFSFLFRITLPFGLLFQLPIVLLFLARIGILNPALMVKFRKYAYFVLFVIAAMITPPELVSHLIVTVPMFILYEISIMVSRVGYRKFLKSEEQLMQAEMEREKQLQLEEALALQQQQIAEAQKNNDENS